MRSPSASTDHVERESPMQPVTIYLQSNPAPQLHVDESEKPPYCRIVVDRELLLYIEQIQHTAASNGFAPMAIPLSADWGSHRLTTIGHAIMLIDSNGIRVTAAAGTHHEVHSLLQTYVFTFAEWDVALKEATKYNGTALLGPEKLILADHILSDRERDTGFDWDEVCDHFGLDTSFMYAPEHEIAYYDLLLEVPAPQDSRAP